MYPAQVTRITKLTLTLEEIIAYLQDKVDNAGDSDNAQDRASSLEDIISELESASQTLTDAKDNLEAIE